MFTLVDWIIFGFIFIFMFFGTIALFTSDFAKVSKVFILFMEIILFFSIVGGCAMYNTKTESGKRSVKSWQSETSGGIDRTVTVYDINGEEVAKYTGRFDVEESSQEGVVKIKFDCDGKRHIIYAQTGTVLIDEN
jgi:hypothetical protein